MDPQPRQTLPESSRPLDDVLARTLPQLRCFVQRRLGQRLAARERVSDLVQSVCRQVLSDPTTPPSETSALRRRLFVVARHKLADRARHHDAAARSTEREASFERLDGVVIEEPSPLENIALREETERVQRAIATLPPSDRDVIVLSVLLGVSHHEVARHLGSTEAATRSRLSRALAKLALRLGS
jgi:RNA polymerase sigma factor (sigma-70 family)